MRTPGRSQHFAKAGGAGALLVVFGLSGVFCGCDDRTEVEVTQPIAFSHEKHLAYFSTGKHRQEMLEMHRKKLEVDEVPVAIQQGRCVKCHAQLEEKVNCAGCHLPAQDPVLRARTDVRACVGCHRGTWKGSLASIPSNTVCRSCHDGEPKTDGPEEKHLRQYLSARQDIPWMQINTVPPSIFFSHSAHVHSGKMACTVCHDSMTDKSAPPTTATVFTMDACIKCHEDNHVSTDCLTCHK